MVWMLIAAFEGGVMVPARPMDFDKAEQFLNDRTIPDRYDLALDSLDSGAWQSAPASDASAAGVACFAGKDWKSSPDVLHVIRGAIEFARDHQPATIRFADPKLADEPQAEARFEGRTITLEISNRGALPGNRP